MVYVATACQGCQEVVFGPQDPQVSGLNKFPTKSRPFAVSIYFDLETTSKLPPKS